ncbi:phosphate transport system permease protein [Streptococcus rupicaprae]|uniref:Phosphate transport system permease protein PstA n=1 Tax=Streptococcus rupicaprae TaxID=759619 RepID=A0ABV2FHP4_9STRE
MLARILRVLVFLSAAVTFGFLFLVIGFILVQGLPHLGLDLFSWTYRSENMSLLPSIITTLILVIGSLLLAIPLGVFAGFYLVEYAKKDSKVVELIRLAADTLQGVPSIVFGLFGMLFFVVFCRFQYSLLSGILTSVIMVLPLIIRATEEGLLSVPDSVRQASFALGAGKIRTIMRIVLPEALPGILAGVLLSIGRIVGETAALMYTLGTSTNMPKSLMDSGRTLSLHMYVLSSEGLYLDEAYATGVILILIVLIIQTLSTRLSKQLVKGNH